MSTNHIRSNSSANSTLGLGKLVPRNIRQVTFGIQKITKRKETLDKTKRRVIVCDCLILSPSVTSCKYTKGIA